jgi:hypothetical protein
VDGVDEPQRTARAQHPKADRHDGADRRDRDHRLSEEQLRHAQSLLDAMGKCDKCGEYLIFCKCPSLFRPSFGALALVSTVSAV